MASDLTSILLKAILEAQQREMAWDPTSHHSFESSSTYQGSLPNGYSSQEYQYRCDEYPTQEHQDEYGGYSSQEYQYGYGDGYESWSMEHEATYSSQISVTEECLNLAKLALEKQEEYNEIIMKMNYTDSGAWSHDAQIAEPTDEKDAQTQDECLQESWEKITPKDVFLQEDPLQEAEDVVKEFELLLGCTIGEDLVIRYEEEGKVMEKFEDPCEDGLGVECIRITRESTTQNELSTMEEMHKQPDSKQESYGEKLMEEQEIIIEEASEENEKEESPWTQHFDKHLGILPTTPLSFHGPRKTPFEKVKMKKFRDWFNYSPRKIPFEEIRMNEFGGWFYDEYDPGDPSSPSLPPKPTSTVKLKRR